MSIFDQLFRFSFVFMGLPKIGPNRRRPTIGLLKTPADSISQFLATTLSHRLTIRRKTTRTAPSFCLAVQLSTILALGRLVVERPSRCRNHATVLKQSLALRDNY